MRRRLVAAVALAAGVLLAGCAPEDAVPQQAPTGEDRATPTEQSSSVPSPTSTQPRLVPRGRASRAPTESPTESPTRAEPAYSAWKLGSQVLPRAANGYGVIEPTPASLRVRRYPTTDLLPPPADGGWHDTVGPITAAVREKMGTTWHEGCPVPLSGLSYVTVSFRGFDGAAHTGELVVNATKAANVVEVFHTLFDADFPFEEMRLPSTTDLEAPPTGDGNDTASFVCRPTTGATTTFSAHAYGLAIDVNPFDNPYTKDGLVLPERASAYLDRSWRRPGMVFDGDVVVRAFAAVGWSWGGDFSSLKDYQHFTQTGR